MAGKQGIESILNMGGETVNMEQTTRAGTTKSAGVGMLLRSKADRDDEYVPAMGISEQKMRLGYFCVGLAVGTLLMGALGLATGMF